MMRWVGTATAIPLMLLVAFLSSGPIGCGTPEDYEDGYDGYDGPLFGPCAQRRGISIRNSVQSTEPIRLVTVTSVSSGAERFFLAPHPVPPGDVYSFLLEAPGEYFVRAYSESSEASRYEPPGGRVAVTECESSEVEAFFDP